MAKVILSLIINSVIWTVIESIPMSRIEYGPMELRPIVRRYRDNSQSVYKDPFVYFNENYNKNPVKVEPNENELINESLDYPSDIDRNQEITANNPLMQMYDESYQKNPELLRYDQQSDKIVKNDLRDERLRRYIDNNRNVHENLLQMVNTNNGKKSETTHHLMPPTQTKILPHSHMKTENPIVSPNLKHEVPKYFPTHQPTRPATTNLQPETHPFPHLPLYVPHPPFHPFIPPTQQEHYGLVAPATHQNGYNSVPHRPNHGNYAVHNDRAKPTDTQTNDYNQLKHDVTDLKDKLSTLTNAQLALLNHLKTESEKHFETKSDQSYNSEHQYSTSTNNSKTDQGKAYKEDLNYDHNQPKQDYDIKLDQAVQNIDPRLENGPQAPYEPPHRYNDYNNDNNGYSEPEPYYPSNGSPNRQYEDNDYGPQIYGNQIHRFNPRRFYRNRPFRSRGNRRYRLRRRLRQRRNRQLQRLLRRRIRGRRFNNGFGRNFARGFGQVIGRGFRAVERRSSGFDLITTGIINALWTGLIVAVVQMAPVLLMGLKALFGIPIPGMNGAGFSFDDDFDGERRFRNIERRLLNDGDIMLGRRLGDDLRLRRLLDDDILSGRGFGDDIGLIDDLSSGRGLIDDLSSGRGLIDDLSSGRGLIDDIGLRGDLTDDFNVDGRFLDDDIGFRRRRLLNGRRRSFRQLDDLLGVDDIDGRNVIGDVDPLLDDELAGRNIDDLDLDGRDALLGGGRFNEIRQDLDNSVSSSEEFPNDLEYIVGSIKNLKNAKSNRGPGREDQQFTGSITNSKRRKHEKIYSA